MTQDIDQTDGKRHLLSSGVVAGGRWGWGVSSYEALQGRESDVERHAPQAGILYTAPLLTSCAIFPSLEL